MADPCRSPAADPANEAAQALESRTHLHPCAALPGASYRSFRMEGRGADGEGVRGVFKVGF